MVYKGVIFIHFPCMKIAAGWHRIIIPKALLVLAEHTLTSAACGSAVVWRLDTASRCVIPGIASLIPCFHCLYPTLSDSIPPVKVHHFMIISPCVGFYPNIFRWFPPSSLPAEHVVTLHFLVRREPPRTPWEVFQP